MTMYPNPDIFRLDQAFLPATAAAPGTRALATPWLMARGALDRLEADGGLALGPQQLLNRLNQVGGGPGEMPLHALERKFTSLACFQRGESVGDFVRLQIGAHAAPPVLPGAGMPVTPGRRADQGRAPPLSPLVLLLHAAVIQSLQQGAATWGELIWFYAQHKGDVLRSLAQLLTGISNALEVFYGYNGNLLDCNKQETPQRVTVHVALAFSPLLRALLPLLDEREEVSGLLRDHLDAIQSVFFGLGIYTADSHLIPEFQQAATLFSREWSDQVFPLLQGGLSKALRSLERQE